MKSLPGLVNQQYELRKCVFGCEFELAKVNEGEFMNQYLGYDIFLM